MKEDILDIDREFLEDERIPSCYRKSMEKMNEETFSLFLAEFSEELTRRLRAGEILIGERETIKGIIKLVKELVPNYSDERFFLLRKYLC